jgi:N-acetylglucosamine kinase-like BadF-type ATPase
MPYILGVDGGGSKTYTVITDEAGNKWGRGISGCGNHQILGINTALQNIKISMDMALKQAGLSYADIDFAQYGLAGADREKDFNILRPALDTLPIKQWELVCDTYEGLRIGSKDNIGVVLVCGTGTNAAGRNQEGKTIQTGGLGYFYGDGAGVGGSSLAVETFRAAIRSWEQREIPSILTKRVPEYFNFSNIEELYNDFYERDIHKVDNNLTIVLHQAADEGDELSVRILSQAGIELGIAANSVIRRLGGIHNGVIPIVLVGSVVQRGRNPHLLQSLKETIKKESQSIELIIPKMAPVYGSILLGMDHLNIEVTEEIHRRFEHDMEAIDQK